MSLVPRGAAFSCACEGSATGVTQVDNVAEADATHFKLHNSVHIWANVDELLLGAMSGGRWGYAGMSWCLAGNDLQCKFTRWAWLLTWLQANSNDNLVLLHSCAAYRTHFAELFIEPCRALFA